MFKKLISLFCLLFAAFISHVYADPTRPTFVSSEVLKRKMNNSVPALEALFMTPAGHKAIINGEVFLEGQEKSGLRVVRIEKDSVDIEYMQNGQRQATSLSIKSADMLTKSASEIKKQ